MSKKTLLLIIFLALLTIGLVAFTLTSQTSQNQSPKKAPVQVITPTPAAQSSLLFSPATVDLSTTKPTSPSKIDIQIDTKENKVTAVQLELSFDPTAINVVSIAPGPFLGNPVVLLSNIDTKNGKISYALGISPSESGKSGSGVVATLLFNPLANSAVKQTQIVVTPKTLIAAEGVSQSVLMKSSGTTIILPSTNIQTTKPSPASPLGQ